MLILNWPYLKFNNELALESIFKEEGHTSAIHTHLPARHL